MSSFLESEPRMPEKLTPLMALLTCRVPRVLKPAVAHAVFPALAAHLHGAKFRYLDNVEREATLMCCLLAPMSSGKSAVNKPIERILADIDERDRVNRRREQDWKDLQRMGIPSPRPADLIIQHLCSDMTNPAFVQRLRDAEGRFLYSCMDDLELLSQLKTSARGQQVSQIIRLAFDCGEYGQERIGMESLTAQTRVRWNWNASSTIGSGQRFFKKDLVNGTLSRINFCTITPTVDDEMPVIGSYDAEFDAALKPYIDRLNAASGQIECPEAEALARQLMEENNDVSALCASEAFRTLSYRANVIAYLKAMVLYVAEGGWSAEAEAFIRWSEQYDLWCKMRFFGEELQRQMNKENGAVCMGPKNLLEELPDSFSRQEVVALRQSRGMSANPKDMIHAWIRRGLIKRTDVEDCFAKTDYYLSKHSAA